MGEPDAMPVEDLMRLLDIDPTAFARLIVPQLHKQYQQALEALCAVMQNPNRERKVAREHITAWLTSGQPALQRTLRTPRIRRLRGMRQSN